MADDSRAELALAAGLVQPDPTTCGSCVLVVARMLNDPTYADRLVDGPPAGTLQDRFRHDSLAMHRLTTGFKDTGGGWQVPWPQALGTPPWALAREMTKETGEPGRRYRAEPILPHRRSRAFDRLVSLTGAGHAIPTFVGNRWSPRHVVLALPTDDPQPDDVVIYDPASGNRYPISRGDFSSGRLQVAGWAFPWFVVVPT